MHPAMIFRDGKRDLYSKKVTYHPFINSVEKERKEGREEGWKEEGRKERKKE